jgi:hypothetical protein
MNSIAITKDPRRVISLKEAARLSSLSPDTIKRVYPDKIVHLSPRRLGIRLRDVPGVQTTEEA